MCLIFMIGYSFTNTAAACTSDMECGLGNLCVKSSDSISMQGICVTPTDEFGTPETETTTSSSEPHEISGCEFDTDCDIGFSCMKRNGEMTGICMK